MAAMRICAHADATANASALG